VFWRDRYLPVGKPTGRLHPSSKDFVAVQGEGADIATTNIDDAVAAGLASARGQGNDHDADSTDTEGDGYTTGLFNGGDDFVPPVQRVIPAVPARHTVAATTPSSDFEYMTPDGAGAAAAAAAAVASGNAQEAERFDGFGDLNRRSTLVPGVGEVEVFDDFDSDEGAYATSLAQLAKVPVNPGTALSSANAPHTSGSYLFLCPTRRFACVPPCHQCWHGG